MKLESYSVLVNSCDKYEEAWNPFFNLLVRFWNDLNAKVYLNTETKHYNNDSLNVICLNSNEKSWGKRLANALRQIDTPYVIFLLEDFFLLKDVNEEEIRKCVRLMDDNPDIAVFYFHRTTGYCYDSPTFQEYYEMHVNETNHGEYLINCQAAIWRKDILISIVEQYDNPWSLELYGYKSIPSEKLLFLCSKNSRYDAVREKDVFSYIDERSKGYGIWGGKWLWKNGELFEKYDIKCNMSTLPTMSQREFLIDHFFEITIKRPIRKCLKIVNGRGRGKWKIF